MALLRPYLDQDLVVGVECMFKCYWLADLCRQHGIRFVLGHAWAMKAIQPHRQGSRWSPATDAF